MAFVKSKQGQWVLLALAVLVLGWLFVRAAGAPGPGDGAPTGAASAPDRSATATAQRVATQRHTGSATPAPTPTSGLAWIAESALPREARDTLALIRAGGPYPFPRSDNQTFGNRERFLPRQPGGYYREYTVTTPGSHDRGARRIISGRAGDRYYTDDHYESFRQIREGI